MKEKPNSVVLNFSNHTLGVYFNPYKEHFSLQTVLGNGEDIPVRKFDVNFFVEVTMEEGILDI